MPESFVCSLPGSLFNGELQQWPELSGDSSFLSDTLLASKLRMVVAPRLWLEDFIDRSITTTTTSLIVLDRNRCRAKFSDDLVGELPER